jgi:hypothetical protein
VIVHYGCLRANRAHDARAGMTLAVMANDTAKARARLPSPAIMVAPPSSPRLSAR